MTATKRIAFASLAITMAFAQDTPKKAPKPFVEPPVRWGRLKSGSLLLKDEGCARDFVRAGGFEGVEKRKLLVDTFKFGCVRIIRDVAADEAASAAQFGEGGAKLYQQERQRLTNDLKASGFDLSQGPKADPMRVRVLAPVEIQVGQIKIMFRRVVIGQIPEYGIVPEADIDLSPEATKPTVVEK